jgi:uncharacterized Tic20 family protein
MAKTNEIPESDQGSASEAGNKQKVDVQQAQRVEPSQPSKEIDKDARMWAMFLPVLPVIGNVIAPLIIWQIKKDDYPFVNEQGKEAVNFQISMLIYGLVAGLLCFACIGLILLPAVVIVDVVFLLIAAVKANEGYHYRYPLTIRFIK